MQPPFNQKNRNPSEVMWEPDGSHYRCSWIEGSITVHSDGNVTCGLDDPQSQRSFGNVHESPIEEIFRNPEYHRLQQKLWRGHRCHGCGLYRRVEADHDPSAEVRPRLPRELVVEATVKCNLRCPNTACIPNNDPLLKTRNVQSLDLETLRSVADQLAPSLETIHFYNYGEPFVNKRAEEMLLHLRRKCPGALIVTSTNGIPLANPSRAEKVVLAEPDRIIFTISGITQDVYEIYHVAGKCEQALAGLRNVCEAKRRLGRTRTEVIVRYLVFHWNDSDEQIDGVIALAEQYDVDRLSLFLTDEPKGARSLRFSPGSPSYNKYKKYLRFDHLGRLDHLYHCELPNEDGLYQPEEIPGFGEVRRTGSEATLRRSGRNGKVRLAIATDRPLSQERAQICRVRTPWRTVEVPLTFGGWELVSIPVPRGFREAGPLEIRVTTDDPWFPAEECPNTDLRCLGVLIRSGRLMEPGVPRPRLRALASFRRSWRRRMSRTLLGRLLSSWNTTLFARPSEAGGQAPPRGAGDLTDSPGARPHAQSVIGLYRTLFGRRPRTEELRGWMEALLDGRSSTIQVAQDFASSAEFREVHGDAPTPEAFAAAACRNALGREPDPADCRKWAHFLAEHGNGKPARAAAALEIAKATAILDS